ncbi:putative alpha/beta hydrolase [Mycolicibacterium goodii]|uniref:putative alpha/beta hydrolase n=1 Tax=Mycolicibacterium goodii TaxID=134601 RepID=UPI000A95D1D4|nr:hypothetical protein [Mycolicibacterium goodii]MBU8808560.1 hypothetical protein [Mycolicibacterium goodii]MBU8818209.1 hypothetical protein [Mycolicibacterium goodii]
MQLQYLNKAELIGVAGGDPWQLNETIQSGAPGEISDLASAFYKAGACAGSTVEEFNAAKQRFESAWDREDSGHPINDSAEVQRATQKLHLTWEQLGRISVDLQNIAASLAEAQSGGATSINNLEATLQTIDDQISSVVATAEATGQTTDWSELKERAIEQTRSALHEIQGIRDSYSEQLHTSQLEMAAEGYRPEATEGADGEGGLTPSELAQKDADRYSATQRAADQALVDSPGPPTPEKEAAAGRLRDYGIVTDPNASPEASRLAGERLNDFFTAQMVGPLARDPILGRDARERASDRLQLQSQLENGFGPLPPMSPDAATALLDSAEAQARQLAISQAVESLTRAGMSPEGAQSVVAELASGVHWNQILEVNGQLAGGAGAGAQVLDKTLPAGGHYKPDVLTAKDAGILGDVGKRLGWAGTAVEVFDLGYDLSQGAAPGQRIGEFIGSTGGGALGTIGAAALAGSVFGPGGTFVAAVAASIALSEGGKQLGGWIGSQFDK